MHHHRYTLQVRVDRLTTIPACPDCEVLMLVRSRIALIVLTMRART